MCLKIILCSPVLIPQIIGGEIPFEFDTEKVSVRHWVAAETGMPLAATVTGTPLSIAATVVDNVDGPDITKVLKSNLS